VKGMWSVSGAAEEAVLPGVVAPDSHVEFVFHLGQPFTPTTCSCTLQQCCRVQSVLSPQVPVLAGYEIHFSAKQLAHDRPCFRRSRRVAVESE